MEVPHAYFHSIGNKTPNGGNKIQCEMVEINLLTGVRFSIKYKPLSIPRNPNPLIFSYMVYINQKPGGKNPGGYGWWSDS